MSNDEEIDNMSQEESLLRANRLLREALRALDEGRMVAAGNYAKTAKKVGIASISRYKSAVEALIATRNTLNRARERGIDIKRAEEYFSQARGSLRTNKFSEVHKFCRLAFLACQPEPEQGRDYVIRTHFRRVEEETGEPKYIYDVGIANVTDAPIEKLNIIIPADIDRLFMAKETENSIHLEGKESRVISFVMEPVEGLEEIEGFIVGRDLEVKTILTAEGKNLLYRIRVNNISESVIPSLTLTPPVFEGYVPDPGEVSLDNIYPLEGASANFEIVPEYSAPIVTPAEEGEKQKKLEMPSESGIEKREWDVEKAVERLETIPPVFEERTPPPFFSEKAPLAFEEEEEAEEIEKEGAETEETEEETKKAWGPAPETEVQKPIFQLEEEGPPITPLLPDEETIEGEAGTSAAEEVEEEPELNFDEEENWVPPWDRIENMGWESESRDEKEKEGNVGEEKAGETRKREETDNRVLSESDAELEFTVRDAPPRNEEDDMEEIDDENETNNQEGGN